MDKNMIALGVFVSALILIAASMAFGLFSWPFAGTLYLAPDVGIRLESCVMTSESKCETFMYWDGSTPKGYLFASYKTNEFDAIPKGTYNSCEVRGHGDWVSNVWEVDYSTTIRRRVGGSWKIIRLADLPEFQNMICMVSVPEGEVFDHEDIRFYDSETSIPPATDPPETPEDPVTPPADPPADPPSDPPGDTENPGTTPPGTEEEPVIDFFLIGFFIVILIMALAVVFVKMRD